MQWRKVFEKAFFKGGYAVAGALVPILLQAESLSSINWDQQAPALIAAAIGGAVLGGGVNYLKHSGK